mgnify:FL=1
MSLYQSRARINVWEGAVRSGKSYASMLRWILYCIYGPAGDLMMVGKTNTSIYRNVIKPMIELIGADAQYYSGKQEMSLWGRTIYIVGANDERAQGKIQGSTLAGAYVDEASLIPESFFKMLLSRLSIPDSKLFCTTNPDSPFHWLKTDFIDRKDELNDVDLAQDGVDTKLRHLASWSFLMEDNPSLTEDYKTQLKREYRGLWYKRYIEGQWVLAEGTIYDFFDMDLHTIKLPPGPALYYIVGIDYGTINPTAFTLIGYNPHLFPNMWLEKECYWDSRKQNRQKTDSEFAADLKKFIQGYIVKALYIDPSAASFKVEMRKQGIDKVFDAENDVLDGIRFQSLLISNGTYKICRNCTHAIKEYSQYRWDDKSVRLGEDKPLKENDHVSDSQRYALYTHFFNKNKANEDSRELDQRWQRVAGNTNFGGPFDQSPNLRRS